MKKPDLAFFEPEPPLTKEERETEGLIALMGEIKKIQMDSKAAQEGQKPELSDE